MAEMPTCSRCSRPHWRFVRCEAVAAAPAPAPSRPVRREFAVPPGYVQVAPGKFAKADTNVSPSYVQIAPGKYRKVA